MKTIKKYVWFCVFLFSTYGTWLILRDSGEPLILWKQVWTLMRHRWSHSASHQAPGTRSEEATFAVSRAIASHHHTQIHVSPSINDSDTQIHASPSINDSDTQIHVSPSINDSDTQIHVSPSINDSDTFRVRNQHISKVCENQTVRQLLNQQQLPGSVEVLYYSNIGACYCKVPKAASTLLLNTLIKADSSIALEKLSNKIPGSIHGHKLTRTRRVDQCPEATPISFSVTRDPYSRLFSAFIDKIYLTKFESISKLIDSYVNTNITASSESQANTTTNVNRCTLTPVRFNHFLKYIGDSDIRNPHFVPSTSLCDPCQHRYDAILKQENMGREFNEIQSYFNVSAPPVPGDTPALSSRVDSLESSADASRVASPESSADVSRVASLDADDSGDATLDDSEDARLRNLLVTLYRTFKAHHRKQNCSISQDLNHRVWTGMKILGFIHADEQFPDEIFADNYLRMNDTGEAIFQAFKRTGVPYLSAKDKARQRRQYLIQAYRNVDSDTLKAVQKMFHLDFLMYNYTTEPPS